MKSSHVVVFGVRALALSSAVAVAGGEDIVFVDDGFADNDPGDPVGFPAGTPPIAKEVGLNAFASMQAGIDVANDAGTVNVAAGTYRGILRSIRTSRLSVRTASRRF